MKITKILVTGDDIFLHRHRGLFDAISKHINQLDYLPISKINKDNLIDFIAWFITKLLYKVIGKFSLKTADRIFHKNSQVFINKTKKIERKIGQLEYIPDIVFHVFSMYRPFWHRADIPYVMYLDYTMALAVKNWSAWAPFNNERELLAWWKCERESYERAYHLFTFSHVTQSSLIQDYKISPEKITVVGSAGNIQEFYQGEKKKGTQQILFNASDFERKGGDLVLAAFSQVRQLIPNATLVIIGKKLAISQPGVINLGKVSSRLHLQDIFLKTDVVVAPAYCDPFPTFVLEAMSYGIPCIVTNRDGMPEIVDDRINGIVISEVVPEILAKEIINLLTNTDLLASFSQAAKLKIETKFNWENIASKILDVLSK